MAKQILSGAKLYIDGYDVSGDHNAIAYTYGADEKDVTTLGDLTHVRMGGLKQFAASHAGFWEGGTGKIDDALFWNLGLSNVVSSLCPTTGVEGERSFFGIMTEVEYAPGGEVGDVLPFSVNLEANSDLWRGTVLHNTVRTVTGTGTIMNLGAVASLQRVVASLHVYGPVTGGTPSLTVKVQSAALVGFGSPTDRFTFGAKTAIGAEQLPPLQGPITDAFWRATWTISGSGPPSFPFLVSLAIQ